MLVRLSYCPGTQKEAAKGSGRGVTSVTRRAVPYHCVNSPGDAISNGRQIAAARLIGADLASLAMRFIATREAIAPFRFKEMIVASKAADIIYTPNLDHKERGTREGAN